MINRFLKDKAIVLNNENSQKSIFTKITYEYYTYIYTSLENDAFFKKFKKCILD